MSLSEEEIDAHDRTQCREAPCELCDAIYERNKVTFEDFHILWERLDAMPDEVPVVNKSPAVPTRCADPEPEPRRRRERVKINRDLDEDQSGEPRDSKKQRKLIDSALMEGLTITE